jgi:hypothetical protein
MRRTAATLTAALAVATGGFMAAGAQAADDGGPNNVVWSTTTGTAAVDEGSSVAVGSYPGDDLKSANVARSDSTDCTNCRTVAVAVQAVFATGNPSTVEPTNAAIAINQNCDTCTTYAYAYQYVLTTDGPVKLTGRARRQIWRLRSEIDDVAHSELAPPDMDSRLNELTAEFKADIDADLKRQDERGHGQVKRDDEVGGAQPAGQ